MLENVKIQNMCSSCLDATVAAISASDVLDYRNNLIQGAVQEILVLMQQQRENRIIRPPAHKAII